MVRKVHKYADGGKVVKDHTAQEKPKKLPNGGKLKNDVYTPDKPVSAADAMKNTRKKQMEDLGL